MPSLPPFAQAVSTSPAGRARWVLAPLLGLVGCTGSFDLSVAKAPKGSSEAEETGDPAAAAAELVVAPAAFARLTTRQYRNLLEDLIGGVPEVGLQADTNPYLFSSIGASTEPLSEQGVQQIEEASFAIASAVLADPARREALLGCVPADATDACARNFLADFGLRAYRRPLTTEELDRWVEVSGLVAEGDPYQGVLMAMAGILQSPNVLYRVEVGETDVERPDLVHLTDYEIATRLSLTLWNTVPDRALLDAAAAGRLRDPAGLRAEVERMLGHERTREGIEVFFEEYLDLGRLDRAAPDAATYPAFTPSLRAAMRAEVMLLVDDLVNRRNVDVRALFSERRAFVNSELAAHYGLSVSGASPITFVPVDLPADGERAGILGLGAFLTMNAHAVDTSPTLRGKYVIERVLCVSVPPPPGDVDTSLTEGGEEAATLRERLERHREDPACSGCHALMDPPGFLFEHFDATGAYRDLDNGVPIDSSGDLLGTALSGSGALGDVLATHPQVGPCMVKQLYRHAHGRLDEERDEANLAQISEQFAAADHRFRDLLLALLTHSSFTTMAPPEVSP